MNKLAEFDKQDGTTKWALKSKPVKSISLFDRFNDITKIGTEDAFLALITEIIDEVHNEVSLFSMKESRFGEILAEQAHGYHQNMRQSLITQDTDSSVDTLPEEEKVEPQSLTYS